MSRLVLLPGWGFGPAALEPLVAALGAEGLAVESAALPALETTEPAAWLDELDARLPADAWLGGWSLGGMLAAGLATRRAARCPGLLSLASNACFVARPDWPTAMAPDTFAAFRDGCAEDARATLKRFALLCAQGCPEARGLSRQLGQGAPEQALAWLLAGLDALAALDNRAALAAFAGPQLHLLAEADALVPAAAAEPLRALLTARGSVEVVAGTGHAFLLGQPQALAARLAAFVREAGDD